jgi:hypothetical protein
MSLTIRRLAPDDDRERFSSGHQDLDRFFHCFAGQDQFRHHLGVTYVAVEDEAILRFVTVSPSEIEIDALPADRRRRSPRYPLQRCGWRGWRSPSMRRAAGSAESCAGPLGLRPTTGEGARVIYRPQAGRTAAFPHVYLTRDPGSAGPAWPRPFS